MWNNWELKRVHPLTAGFEEIKKSHREKHPAPKSFSGDVLYNWHWSCWKLGKQTEHRANNLGHKLQKPWRRRHTCFLNQVAGPLLLTYSRYCDGSTDLWNHKSSLFWVRFKDSVQEGSYCSLQQRIKCISRKKYIVSCKRIHTDEAIPVAYSRCPTTHSWRMCDKSCKTKLKSYHRTSVSNIKGQKVTGEVYSLILAVYSRQEDICSIEFVSSREGHTVIVESHDDWGRKVITIGVEVLSIHLNDSLDSPYQYAFWTAGNTRIPECLL